MRFQIGFALALIALTAVSLHAQESDQKEAFRSEIQDIENLRPHRIDPEDATNLIRLLALLPAAILLLVLAAKYFWFNSDVQNTKLTRERNASNTFRASTTRGQGADIVPGKGISNDPL